VPESLAGDSVLGVDVGAVSVSAAEVGFDGEVLRTFYELHHGDIETTLSDVLGRLDLSRITTLTATTSTPSFIRVDRRFDNQICLITAARRWFPAARSILVVGGERFGLIRFDEDGRYLSFRSNPLCAAGTGSCQAGLVSCNGLCVDTTSDATHCGGCNHPCRQYCYRGICRGE